MIAPQAPAASRSLGRCGQSVTGLSSHVTGRAPDRPGDGLAGPGDRLAHRDERLYGGYCLSDRFTGAAYGAGVR